MNIFNQRDLIGNSKSSTALLEIIAQRHALNCTGRVNYNMYGKKDGVGLVAVTQKFIDNFILAVLVPDYNVNNRRNVFIGSQNKGIRDLMDAHGIKSCIVKATNFSKLSKPPTGPLLEYMPYRNPTKIPKDYYVQEFKVACPNVDYKLIIDFLRSTAYNTIGMVLKDFDVTTDYSGSFSKDEIVAHLVSEKGFREQGTDDLSPRTIVNNDKVVGKNCLTYMEEVGGVTTRSKIYNKMVQMLECQSVRAQTGCHWKDWATQKGTRLAAARDQSCERGLTRAEVTIYVVDGCIPEDDFIEITLKRIVEYIPNDLVYTTSFSNVWRAYCDTFQHSLVCVDNARNSALVVYGYNEVTGKISGQFIEKWDERWKWCIIKLTLNGNLPVDVIEATTLGNVITQGSKTKTRNDKLVEVTGSRFYKLDNNKNSVFTTRLVSKKGCFSWNKATQEENKHLLQVAGLVNHPNCIPFLATSQANINSKAEGELRKVDEIKVALLPDKTKETPADTKLKIKNEARKIDELRKPLLQKIKFEKEKLKRIDSYVKRFNNHDSVRLRNLDQGTYDIIAARKENTQFGDQYKLLVELSDGLNVVWGNKKITDTINSLNDEEMTKLKDNDSGFLVLLSYKPIAKLTVTGKTLNTYGHTTVFCNLEFPEIDNGSSVSTTKANVTAEIEKCNEELRNIDADEDDTMPIVPRTNMLRYKDYENLTSLKIGSLQTISAVGYDTHYGTERLLIKIGETFYQAGDDVEQNVSNLTKDCLIRLEKTRVNRNRHTKYVICSIFKKGDWSAMVDYAKTQFLTKLDGRRCIVDVKTVSVKGDKRKLVLTDKGDVFKIKKSRLEDTIEPGFY